VFPGGRVDHADADPRLWRDDAAARVPEAPYWAAAIRELFEETGVLLARSEAGEFAPDATDAVVRSERESLLQDQTTLADVLSRLALLPALDRMQPCAHWITPVAEPKRYNTHFFLAAMPPGRTASADPREMSDAVWLTAGQALERFRAGRLPMVFPTVRTLESILPYQSVEAAIEAFRGRIPTPVLPRLVRTQHGVALLVDEPQENHDGK
jgi:8-oxo-dGTP pyrophosphatase MutT (NUDIX family)